MNAAARRAWTPVGLAAVGLACFAAAGAWVTPDRQVNACASGAGFLLVAVLLGRETTRRWVLDRFPLVVVGSFAAGGAAGLIAPESLWLLGPRVLVMHVALALALGTVADPALGEAWRAGMMRLGRRAGAR